MKKIISALFALSFLLPALVSAQSSNDLQTQAQVLLQQVARLQAQLAAQQGGGTTGTGGTTGSATASGATTATNTCPNVGRVLKRGSTGDDVTRLQQFLAQDPSVYPEGTVSGYYGALTEKAVERWQSKNNIISGGTPATTGYGQVGPRTAAAIALLCSTGASSPVGGYVQVSPISGNAPLNVNVVATVNSTNSCTGAIYQLNWGDSSNPVSIPVSAGNCQPVSQTYQHSYSLGGTYQITLSSGAHQTGANITVYGNSSVGTTGSGTGGTTVTQTPETFSATPVSGATPLTVTFSGVVTGADKGWCPSGCSDILVLGDGAQAAVPLPTLQSQSQNYSLQHTYTTAGTYTATLYQGQAGNGRPTVGSPAVITVGGGSGSTSSSLNPPSVSPAVGGDPKVVGLSFDIGACGSYSVSWGDAGASYPGTAACGGSGTITQTTQHTYAATGNYTITLTRGSQVNTAGISIQ